MKCRVGVKIDSRHGNLRGCCSREFGGAGNDFDLKRDQDLKLGVVYAEVVVRAF